MTEERVQLTPREVDRRMLTDRLLAAVQTVSGGKWDGRQVVPLEDAKGILARPLDAPAHGAEVTTDNDSDGRLTVFTGCPACGMVQPIAVTVGVRLVTDRTHSELRPTFRATARTHECGQEPLPLDAPDGWQTPAEELEDEPPEEDLA